MISVWNYKTFGEGIAVLGLAVVYIKYLQKQRFCILKRNLGSSFQTVLYLYVSAQSAIVLPERSGSLEGNFVG